MMIRRPAINSEIPPLFVWSELAEIERLQERRQELAQRILALPRYSHRRRELETRLKAITIEQLRIQQQIRGRHVK